MKLISQYEEAITAVITIVLADDHKIVRQGIRALLESESDFKVLGEAGSGEEAIELVKQLQPEVLVTDLVMGSMNGIEVTRAVKQILPKTKIIILSMYSNDAYVSEALDAGAKGYVLKESGSMDLASAIRAVVSDGLYLSEPLSEERIKAYRANAKGNYFHNA